MKFLDDPERYQSFGRRLVAVHEAGHIIVARHHGIPCSGLIFPKGDGWAGLAITKKKELAQSVNREFSVAGAVAQMIYMRIPMRRWYQYAQTGLMSKGDWGALGARPSKGHAVLWRGVPG